MNRFFIVMAFLFGAMSFICVWKWGTVAIFMSIMCAYLAGTLDKPE